MKPQVYGPYHWQRAQAPIGMGRDKPFHAPTPPAKLWLRPYLVEIWRQLVIGGSNREIARRTSYSEKTVKNYVADLYLVLGLHQPRRSPTDRCRPYNARVLVTLWGMEIMHEHPEAFRPAAA